MSALQYNFGGVYTDGFLSIIKNAIGGGCDSSVFENKKQIVYLALHLKALGYACAVIETNYVDHDFMEDYAQYYSRCFKPYCKTCTRVHLFNRVLTDAELDGVLIADDEDVHTSLQNAYLGFIVLRPLQKTVIGRTCIKTLENTLPDVDYKALCDIKVSFFGVNLTVRCMPFQEQDNTVAACATSALWSALNVTARLFCHATMTPSSITITAKNTGASLTRAMPNREGLTITEMISAIRQQGLDVVCVRTDLLKMRVRRSLILGNIYAYMALGAPVILVGEIEGLGLHAVTVNGYGIDKAVSSKDMVDFRRLEANDIKKVFVHDDQIGPYTCMGLTDFGDAYDMTTEWTIPNTDNIRRFKIRYLLIPLYDKIRVSYEEIWSMTFAIDAMLASLKYREPIRWRIRLLRSNDFKTQVKRLSGIAGDERLRVMKSGLPKYVWEVSVNVSGAPSAIFCIDATDSGQGLNVIIAIFPTPIILILLKFLQPWIDTALKENPIYQACVAGTRTTTFKKHL